MRRIVLIVAAALAVVAAAPAGGAVPVTIGGTVKVHVTPGTGGPRTAFNVSFRNLAQTGQVGTMHRAETIAVQGTQRRGCVWSGEMPVPAAAAQQLVRLSLAPKRMGSAGAGAWCTGTFRGSVILDEHFNCPPPQMCPMIEIRPQVIGRFSFTVKRRS
jgi:hypothetical protein